LQALNTGQSIRSTKRSASAEGASVHRGSD
jgi:hypothetical protein